MKERKKLLSCKSSQWIEENCYWFSFLFPILFVRWFLFMPNAVTEGISMQKKMNVYINHHWFVFDDSIWLEWVFIYFFSFCWNDLTRALRDGNFEISFAPNVDRIWIVEIFQFWASLTLLPTEPICKVVFCTRGK